MATSEKTISSVFYRNLFFSSGLTLAATSELGDFVVDNLKERRLLPGWRWDTSSNKVEGTLTGSLTMEAFIIERRHTLVAGNEVILTLSNTSPDPADFDEKYEITVSEAGKAIYQELQGNDYQYFAVQITGTNPNLEYMEINWLYLGEEDEVAEGYNQQSEIGYPHVLVVNKDWLNNDRKQKRSDRYQTFSGNQEKVSRTELLDLWLPLNEWAINYPFIWMDDKSSADRIASETRLVEWVNPHQWKASRQARLGTDSSDLFRFALALKEIAIEGAGVLI